MFNFLVNEVDLIQNRKSVLLHIYVPQFAVSYMTVTNHFLRNFEGRL